ncbi:hypothetical protein L7F22_024279 [Adiantum nelumboides]|nr:hypothetical protein [Adiantum nelumboides]
MALSQPFHRVPHAIHIPSRAKAYLQGGWDVPEWLCGIVKRGFSQSILHPRMLLVVARPSSQTGGQSFWSLLFPQHIRYSSNSDDVDLTQLSELWAKTLNEYRDPPEIAKALRYSYSIIAALDHGEGSDSSQPRLVGFGRAVSDGAFIATICDVAVDPAYQRRGIGRRIVKELVKTMKQSEGPSGFAVFPPPKARLFFWSIGFRPDRNYRFMTYRGKLLDSSVQDEDNLDPE